MTEPGVEIEELRFAVVLNGGVSLAVWMGGATHELNRLTHAVGPYATLLEWAMSTARVDVISGTSAGGINGAALALAQANGADEGQSLRLLRDVWLDHGSLQNLLREPFRGAAPSLLDGDGYFLPQLGQALRRLTQGYDPAPIETHPIDLTITTTLLRGVQGVVRDHIDQEVGQVRHDGLFRFRRGPTHPTSRGGTADPPGDDFAAAAILEPGGTLDALAVAARTTASYPVAFEPSFLPARDDDADRDVTGPVSRPNLAPFLSGAWENAKGAPPSRYGVDGGVLANTPTQPALGAISAMPASAAVRRVLMVVHPHAPAITEDEHETPENPPTVVATGAGLLKAITSQGSRNFVDLVKQHNEQATTRRELRASVVAGFPPSPLGADLLHREALDVYGPYRRLRLRELSERVAATWQERPATSGAAAAVQDATSAGVATAASVTSMVLAKLEAFEAPAGTGSDAGADAPTAAVLEPRLLPPEGDFLAWGADLSSESAGFPDPAQLGIDGALGIADVAVDYLRRVMWWSMQDDPELAQVVSDARGEVSRARNAIIELRRGFLQKCAASAGGTPAGLEPWVDAAVEDLATRGGMLDGLLDTIAEAVASAAVSRTEVIDDGSGRDIGRLRDFAGVLFPEFPDMEPTPPEVLQRLSQVHVLTDVTLLQEPGSSLQIDLVQLTHQVRHPFAPGLLSGEDKVAGDLIARFSAFLKRSWRINDWTWGRLDAARVLCRTVLEPDRVRRFLAESPEPTEELATRLLDGISEDPDVREHMGLPPPEQLAAELDELAGNADAPLTLLPEVFAAAVALEIAGEELPEIPRAVDHDLAQGSARRSPSAVAMEGAREEFEAARDGSPAERWTGLERLATTGIGRESLGDEASSDLMIQTISGTAATTVTMLDGERSGLGALKPLTRVLRGGALLPYWAVRGLTGGDAAGRVLAQMTLALGGVLVLLGLLGAAPAWVTTTGTGLVLTGFAYSALRTGTILHGVVLLIPALLILALTVPGLPGDGEPPPQPTTQQDATAVVVADDERREESVAVVVAAAVLIVGLLILGSLSPPALGPVGWLRGLSWRRAGPLLLALVVIALFAVAAHEVWVELAGSDLRDLLEDWWDLRWVRIAVAVVAAALPVAMGSGLAWSTRRMGREVDGDESGHSPDAAAAGWSVAYGLMTLAAAAGVAYWWSPLETRDVRVVAALLIGAFLLLVVVPWRLRLRRARALDRRAREAFARAGLQEDAPATDKMQALEVAGVRTRRVVRPGAAPHGSAATGSEGLTLTSAGDRAFQQRHQVR